ncbi:MAG: hypothetical protein PUE13_01000 [Clostridiales bacterium]|nr:hypothetical protein [Clostridiales bacterium]
MNKIVRIIAETAVVLVLAGCGNTAVIGGADGPTAVYVSDDSLSEYVSNAILEYNSAGYYEGECFAEGHIFLGKNEEEGKTVVYALTTYGEYGFENGMFIKISGSGLIPAKIVLDSDGRLIDYEMPEDGNRYIPSIREIFPIKYQYKALKHSDSDYDACLEQERAYAREYLDKIGRKAEIGEYGDTERILLSDLGVSDRVSNELFGKFDKYPYWVGNKEYLEDIDGKTVRVVYEMSFDAAGGNIIFKKYKYNGGEVLESFTVDSVTGEVK